MKNSLRCHDYANVAWTKHYDDFPNNIKGKYEHIYWDFILGVRRNHVVYTFICKPNNHVVDFAPCNTNPFVNEDDNESYYYTS